MDITEYRHTDGLRRWELSYEGKYLVLLNDDAPEPYKNQLLAFDGYSGLSWNFLPTEIKGFDCIVNIWIKNGQLYAGSYSCFEYQLDYKTGEVLGKKFTK